jgi:hypothetical protein
MTYLVKAATAGVLVSGGGAGGGSLGARGRNGGHRGGAQIGGGSELARARRPLRVMGWSKRVVAASCWESVTGICGVRCLDK